MKEIIKDMKVVRKSASCECGGEFIPTGMVYTCNPPLYPHVCNKCGSSENFKHSYPYIDYQES